MIDGVKVFEKELKWIVTDNIREFTKKALTLLPQYFYEVSASSTGKYHPNYALGSGGLIRHTKAAVAIAYDLSQLEMYDFDEMSIDLILSALILHDGMKHGKRHTAYSIADHPSVVSNWILSNTELNSIIDEVNLKTLCRMIETHMGQWNTDYKTKKEILRKPETKIEEFVHLCDYLGSRKYLDFDFGGDYYKPENYFETDETKLELKEIIEFIIKICKQRIKDGEDRDILYKVISSNNNGNKNPNSIQDIEIAKLIYDVLYEPIKHKYEFN